MNIELGDEPQDESEAALFAALPLDFPRLGIRARGQVGNASNRRTGWMADSIVRSPLNSGLGKTNCARDDLPGPSLSQRFQRGHS